MLSSTHLTAYIQSAAPGPTATLTVDHGGHADDTIEVTLGTAGA